MLWVSDVTVFLWKYDALTWVSRFYGKEKNDQLNFKKVYILRENSIPNVFNFENRKLLFIRTERNMVFLDESIELFKILKRILKDSLEENSQEYEFEKNR